MTDRTQFEAMLDALINEDQDAAKEIFHNIVVAKSREIYEELLAEDFGAPEEEEEEEEEIDGEDDSTDDEDDSSDDEVGGDSSDDFINDVEDDETDSDDSEGGLEDRVMDLEDALDELRAEFEDLMADEANEPEHNDGIDDPSFGADDMFGDEEGSEDEFGADLGADDQEVKEIHHIHHMQEGDREFQEFMEYVNKVALPKHGDNGANAKSIVAGKNDMGGTAANIAKGFSTTSGGTKGGLLNPSATVDDAGNQNKPGASVGKSAFKKQQPGHGAEKKGKGESAPNPKSIIGSRK